MVDKETIKPEENTVELSVSSETPVARDYGYEILKHSNGSIDLSRFATGAAIRDTHYGDQIGVIEKAWVDDSGKKLRVKARFSQNTNRAIEVFKDIVDGIRRNVSILYEINAAEAGPEIEGQYSVIITKWAPVHVSMEPDGADPNVGIGRSNDDIKDSIKIKNINSRSSKMTEEEKKQLEEQQKAAIASALESANARSLTMLKIATDFQANVPGTNLVDEAQQFIATNKTVEEFRSFVMDKFKNASALRTPATNVDMGKKDENKFSLTKALRAIVDGKADSLGVEFESSKVIAGRLGRAQTSKNLFIPAEIQRRDLVVGTPANGGYTVQNQYIPQSFVEILQSALIAGPLGVQIIDGLIGDIPMTRELTENIAYWIAESNGPTQSDITFGQDTMKPNTLGALTKLGHKWLLQNSAGGEAYVSRKLAMSVAQAYNKALLYGTGTGQPRGLKNITGIGSALGASFARTTALEMYGQISSSNALALGPFKWVGNSNVAATLMGKEIAANTGRFLLDDISGKMLNREFVESNALTDGDLFGGVFNSMILGMWNVLEVQANPLGSGFAAGTVEVRALTDIDFYCEYPDAFSYASGVN